MIDTTNEILVRGTPDQCGACGITTGNILGDIDRTTTKKYGYLCMKCYRLVRDFGDNIKRMRKVLAYSEDTRLGNGARCKNPNCGKPIPQIPGHRRREYCDETCKQTAFRLRHKEPQTDNVTIVDESAQQRIAELEQEVETLKALRRERSTSVNARTRASLQDRLLKCGKEIGYPPLTFQAVSEGPPAWRDFARHASELLLSIALVEAMKAKKSPKQT